MFAHIEDTIVAISSAAGGSPRGVLRLSGPRAIALAAAIFSPRIAGDAGFRRYRGWVRWAAEHAELPAELYVFRAPRSFTRQDMAEIHTIGSPPVLTGLLEEMVRAGARPAEPGEFTGRAFLAGAIDLTAVEGIAAMIHAGSDAQLRAAEHLLHGVLARETQRVQLRLADLLALVEASIDFVDEPIDFVSPGQAAEELAAAAAALRAVLQRAVPIERLDVRHRVVLAGPPNAGKSTLFNRLTGLSRAICSPMPGTTRDVIGAPVSLPGGEEVWLMDSPGTAEVSGEAEDRALELSRQAAGGVDLVLVVVDGTRGVEAQMGRLRGYGGRSHAMIVINKVDLLTAEEVQAARDTVAASGLFVQVVSGLTGAGCPELLERLSSLLEATGGALSSASIAINARHRLALERAEAACGRALAIVREHARVADAAELIALDLREASGELGAIVGTITAEDVLGRSFSRFCGGN